MLIAYLQFSWSFNNMIIFITFISYKPNNTYYLVLKKQKVIQSVLIISSRSRRGSGGFVFNKLRCGSGAVRFDLSAVRQRRGDFYFSEHRSAAAVQYRNFKMAAVRQRQNFNRYGHLCYVDYSSVVLPILQHRCTKNCKIVWINRSRKHLIHC